MAGNDSGMGRGRAGRLSGLDPARLLAHALMGRLRHENLVTVHDFVRLPDGRAAVVMVVDQRPEVPAQMEELVLGSLRSSPKERLPDLSPWLRYFEGLLPGPAATPVVMAVAAHTAPSRPPGGVTPAHRNRRGMRVEEPMGTDRRRWGSRILAWGLLGFVVGAAYLGRSWWDVTSRQARSTGAGKAAGTVASAQATDWKVLAIGGYRGSFRFEPIRWRQLP